MDRERGKPERSCHKAKTRHFSLSNSFAQPFCYHQSTFWVGLWQNHRKLIATKSRRRIHGSKFGAQALRQDSQGNITNVVARLVIDMLEIVEVHHN